MIVQSNVGKSGVRWKLIKLWDVVQGQSIHIFKVLDLNSPVLRGGRAENSKIVYIPPVFL